MKQSTQSVTGDVQRTGFGVFHCLWCVVRWLLFGLIAGCFFIFVTIESVLALENREAPIPEGKSQGSLSGEDVSPQRIVSINLCTDELLLRLVEPGRVAALTRFSDNADVSTVWEVAQGIKKTEPDIESILACGPDLLLGGRFSNREALHFFQYSDTPVLVFDVPKSFEDIYRDIRRLAKAVGTEDLGEEIVQKMKTEMAALRSGEGSPQDVDQKGNLPVRAVFFQSEHYVPGTGTFENAVMEAAGLINIAAEFGITGYGKMDLEQLIAARPDLIIFSGEQKNSRTVRGEGLNHPAIKKALPDVKTVVIPTMYLNCGSPASVKAVRLLAEASRKLVPLTRESSSRSLI